MKTLLTILLLFVLQNSFAQTTHYVSTGGNDANSGTIGSPWATLHYACSQVTTAGDTIYINPGTYIETLPAMVAVGVNIKGADSATTIIKSHYKADWNFNYPNDAAIAFVSSTEGTNGNQSLSGITLDGDNRTGNLGIVIKLRSNVIIHNIKIKDFYINGVSLFGSSIDPYHKPTTYSQGNQLYNITITNCTDTAETYVGGGNINMSGQKNLLLHDFVLADTSRGEGANGDNIVGNPYGIGAHIYNGVSYKPLGANAGWNFHFEIPSEAGGCEINNVNFIGGLCALDLGDNISASDLPLTKHYDSSYGFKYKIHNCYFDGLSPTNEGGHGNYTISIEGSYFRDIIISNNLFKNAVHPFGISDGSATSDQARIYFTNNVSLNTGVDTIPYWQALVTINKSVTSGSLRDVYVINNTILPRSTTYTKAVEITNSNSSTMRNIVIANNNLPNSTNGYWMTVDNTGGTIDSLIVRNNNTYNSANSSIPNFTGNAVTHYINSGNITTDPLLNADGSLQSGSPDIGAAYPYGYGSDIGALQYTTIAPPTISVSGNQTITVANTSVSAVGTPASGQTITGYTWSKVSGAAVTFGTPNSASTTVTGLTTGTYVLRCTVTQSDGQTAYGDVTITVNIPVPPSPPNAYIKLRLPTKFVNK